MVAFQEESNDQEETPGGLLGLECSVSLWGYWLQDVFTL